MSVTVALALGCLLQSPWNSLPVIDCNEGPKLYGAELQLRDGRHLAGYLALSAPLAKGENNARLGLFRPSCGLTLFRDPEVKSAEGDPDSDCIEDEYALQHFDHAWMPREQVLDLAASKIKSMRFKPLAWDGISAERFLVLAATERELIAQNGPRVPITEYQGSGRMELAGGKAVKEDSLWDLTKPIADAVMKGGKAALIAQKKRLLREHIVLLFYPDVEP